MSKRSAIAYLVLAICVFLLAGSYLQWKNKLNAIQHEANIASTKNSGEKNDKTADHATEVDERTRLQKLIRQQDEQVQNVFLNRFDKEQPVRFLIVGSTMMDEGKPGYAERLQNRLKKTYGEFIDITTHSFDGNSSDFIFSDLDKAMNFAKGYDVVFMEPFTLNNTGFVSVEDAQEHIRLFKEKLTGIVEDAVLILQPAQPIPGANFYPSQVAALQNFAAEENIPYIDHWQNWPNPDTEEFLQYVTEDHVPNAEGAEIWASALISYFIDESTEEK